MDLWLAPSALHRGLRALGARHTGATPSQGWLSLTAIVAHSLPAANKKPEDESYQPSAGSATSPATSRSMDRRPRPRLAPRSLDPGAARPVDWDYRCFRNHRVNA